MRYKRLKFIAVLLSGLQLTGLQAQESINVTGGDATGSGGSVAYSIGQVVYTTNTGISGSIAQGVQHAYEKLTVGLNETSLDISLTLFPNPTADIVNLQISNYKNEMLSYLLYDMQGKILYSEKIVANKTQISLNKWPAAAYFIHVVSQENKKYKSFKIIKQ